MLDLFFIVVLISIANCSDQRDDARWPFKKTYNFTNIVIPGQNKIALTKIARSSFKINMTFYADPKLPDYELRVLLMRDIDFSKIDQTQAECLNNGINPSGGEKGLSANRERWCCTEEITKNQLYECFLKKTSLYDYHTWLHATPDGRNVTWEFNRVSYKDELIDFDIATDEIRRYMTTTNNDDDGKTNYVLNLRSADFINWVVVLSNPGTSTRRIDLVVIEENEDLEQDKTQAVISKYIVNRDMLLVYAGIGAAIVLVIVFIALVLSCVLPKGIKNSRMLIELIREDRKLCFRNCFVVLIFHMKDSLDEFSIIWECLGLTVNDRRKDNIVEKLEGYAEETGYRSQVEEERENRKRCKAPGTLVALVLTFIVAYFIEGGIEELSNQLVTPNNACSMAELCCPAGGSVFNEEELVIQPQVDGDEGPVIWGIGEACSWERPTVKIGELEADKMESRYEKCYFSKYSYPVCKIPPYPLDKNDSRPECGDTYDQKPIPLWVQAPNYACKTFDLTSNSFVNGFLMSIVTLVLTFIIVKPMFMPITGFFEFVSMTIVWAVKKIEENKRNKLKKCFENTFQELKEKAKEKPLDVVWWVFKMLSSFVMMGISITLFVLFTYYVVFGLYHSLEVPWWQIILALLECFVIGLLMSIIKGCVMFFVCFRWRKIVHEEEDESNSCSKCKRTAEDSPATSVVSPEPESSEETTPEESVEKGQQEETETELTDFQNLEDEPQPKMVMGEEIENTETDPVPSNEQNEDIVY